MAGQQFSLWDRYTHGAAAGSSLTSELLDRIAGFDQFAQLDSTLRARLELELARRRDYWSAEAAAAGHQMRLWIAAVVIAAVFGVWMVLGGAWPTTILMLIVIAFAAHRMRALKQVRRLGEAIERGLWPDCGYDMTGVDTTILPEDLGGLPAGPPRCPECGVRWPLLPAAMPGGEFTAGLRQGEKGTISL